MERESMPHRLEYFLDLSNAAPRPQPPVSAYRQELVSVSDADELADLMLDAYRGTIDYHGENIDDAREEIRTCFRGGSGGIFLNDFSAVIFKDDRAVSACLCVKSDEHAYPLIAYSMTRASEKGNGLAQYLLASVLQKLKCAGYRGVTAVITEGNIPSERLFRSAGFGVVSA
jgi:GNAT superfamily N-acetyltransferase